MDFRISAYEFKDFDVVEVFDWLGILGEGERERPDGQSLR